MFVVTVGLDGIVNDFLNTQGGMEMNKGFSAGSRATIPAVEAGKRPE
jgi:hypothetical protein